MPRGRSSQNKNVRQYLVWLQPSRLARSIPAALGLLVAVYGCVWLAGQASMIYEQQRMESYLEKKYNEKFVVGSPQYMNGGIAVEGIWKAEAHPQSNNQLKFDVSGNSYGLSDQYVAAVWSVEANRDLHEQFKLPDGLDAGAEIILSGQLVESATKTSPSFEYARKMSDGFLYKLSVWSSIEGASMEKQAFDLGFILKRLNDSGVQNISVEYTAKDGRSCNAYSIPEQISADFLRACFSSKMEWYDGSS